MDMPTALYTSFSNHYHSDYIPTDDEAHQIDCLLSNQSHHLQNIEADIQRVKALYDELRGRRSKLLGLMNGHRSLLSLPRRDAVPVDVLQEIFVHCVPEKCPSRVHRKEAPMSLTQVCRRWRETALSMPRLWTSLQISIPSCSHEPRTTRHSSLVEEGTAGEEAPSTDAKVELQVAGASEWLTRSRSRPLSIDIADHDGVITSQNHFQTILDTILPSIDRWKALQITTSPIRFVEFLKIPTSYPMLETLRLTFIPNWRQDRIPLPVPREEVWQGISLFSSPSLRELHLVKLPVSVTILPVAWDSLTHLTLSWPSEPTTMEDAVPILKLCKKLMVFRLTISCAIQRFSFPFNQNHHSLPNTGSDKTTLQSLTTLSIVGGALSDNPTVFASIEMPTLSSLDWFWPSLPGSPFTSLTQGTNLRRLQTNASMWDNDEEFLRCLRTCQDLVELVLSSTKSASRSSRRQTLDGRDEFLQFLTSRDAGGEYLCPRLEVFERSTDGAEYTERGLMEFVKAKQGSVKDLARLRRLALVFDRPQVEPLAAELAEYLVAGLEVVFEYSEKCCAGVAPAPDDSVPFHSFKESKIF